MKISILRPTRAKDAGYTLLEVLVAVAIISIVAISAPTLYAQTVPKFQVRQYANNVANHLRFLRDSARQDGRARTLSYSATEQLITAAENNALTPSGISVVAEPLGPWQNGAVEEITFYPNGSATGGRLIISRDAVTVTVTIDWISGSIGVEQ